MGAHAPYAGDLQLDERVLCAMFDGVEARAMILDRVRPSMFCSKAAGEVFVAIRDRQSPGGAIFPDEHLARLISSDDGRALLERLDRRRHEKIDLGQAKQLIAEIRARTPVIVEMRRAADVQREDVRWMWSGFLPRGKLVVLEGDPGVGKSALTIDLAARVSTGAPFPDGSRCEASDVLLVSYEDAVADTIQPRLQSAGADLQRVRVVDGVRKGETVDVLTIPDDVPRLREEIEATGAVIVFIDPLNAGLAATVDAHKDAPVRRALAALANLAESTGVTMVVVRHYPKVTGRSAILAGAGSVGIAAAARVVLALHKDPDEETRRILAVVKCNVARLSSSWILQLEERDGSVAIRWVSTTYRTADDLVEARSIMVSDDPRQIEKAEQHVAAALAHGPVAKSTVIASAQCDGIPKRTTERAAHKLGVTTTKGFGEAGFWSL